MSAATTCRMVVSTLVLALVVVGSWGLLDVCIMNSYEHKSEEEETQETDRMVLPNLSNLCITEVHVPITPKRIQEQPPKMTMKATSNDPSSDLLSEHYDDGTIVKYKAVAAASGEVMKYVIQYVLWPNGDEYFYKDGVLQRIEKKSKNTHTTYLFQEVTPGEVRLVEERIIRGDESLRVKKWANPEGKNPYVNSDVDPGQRKKTDDYYIWMEDNDPKKKKKMHQEIPDPVILPDKPDNPDKPQKDGTKKSRPAYRDQKLRTPWNKPETLDSIREKEERKKQRVQSGLTEAFDD